MTDQHLAQIKRLLEQCSVDERHALFRDLRSAFPIHQLEIVFGAPAEVVLEAIHRAPELTRRMIRGVIADAAFAQFILPAVANHGWKDVTPEGNHSFDYKLEDASGSVTVQVKLQRSEKGSPVVKDGQRYGFGPEVFMVEPQKTRGGTDKKSKRKTRPYRYEDFDILAVSLQPSTGRWDAFRYTLSRWLLPGHEPGEIATMQPVAMRPNEYWTDDLVTASQWLRLNQDTKRFQDTSIRKTKVTRPRKAKKRSPQNKT